ncbi:MAG TPA: molybdate ABC transporter substrate-binding protein [Pseudolabrys sp.]|nr:molybdate ABC transporter substrate-binding protein [Pseudolabrys sp.]
MTAVFFAASLFGLAAMNSAAQADTVTLFAAGSLKDALGDVAKAYEAKSGHKVAMKFGPSGLLKKEIADGGRADVFASANMEHPEELHDDGTGGPVVRFARNKMCALVRPGLDVTGDTLLARMLDAKVKLATSTPRADPSGDYAVQVFTKAEALKPGAQDTLEKKSLKLTGAKTSAAPPAGRVAYGWHVAEGRADIFMTYCTNALAARKQYPDQQMVELPAALSVGADYGLTVISGAPPAAQDFAEFILSADGQKILAGYGFAPGD